MGNALKHSSVLSSVQGCVRGKVKWNCGNCCIAQNIQDNLVYLINIRLYCGRQLHSFHFYIYKNALVQKYPSLCSSLT